VTHVVRIQKEKCKDFGLRSQREWERGGGGDSAAGIGLLTKLISPAGRYVTSLRIYQNTRRQLTKGSNPNVFMRLRIGRVVLSYSNVTVGWFSVVSRAAKSWHSD